MSFQFLVKLDNAKTHLISFENNIQPTANQILEKLSLKTNLPSSILRLNPAQPYLEKQSSSRVRFLSVFTYLPILGGKGGFATLLKGQSKQAGAKKTIDFGACRDLNGRRLRHVNDEIKLRKWREGQSASLKSSGGTREELIEAEISRMRTASGIQNWHLMVPTWSEAGGGGTSGKGRAKQERGWRREAERWVDSQFKDDESKKRNKDVRQKAVLDYVQAGEKRGAEAQEKLTNSILEGLKKRRKTVSNAADRVDSEDLTILNDSASSSSSYMCTLSGDFIVEEEKGDSSRILVQSKSEFATGSILINPKTAQPETENLERVYYEVRLVTGGVAQIGWANRLDGEVAFKPNSSTGDGVGDDKESFGFDGCRSLIFHNGIEKKYGIKDKKAGNGQLISWQVGDILGCYRDSSTISYSLNGDDLGVAFENCGQEGTQNHGQKARYPVFSLNENEVISVNIGPHFEYCPDNHIGINKFIFNVNKGNEDKNQEDEDRPHKNSHVAKIDLNCESKEIEKKIKSSKPVDRDLKNNNSGNMNAQESKKCKGLNLNDYESVQQLEALGMDRLKEELYALGCKCGGSLEERAKRLFSLKGLSKDAFPTKVRGKNFRQ